ncbi:hypothetical protein, partial [Megasphaera cerevisiae]|uniref:hypothetical protein n=1 Tax=Megasphaera cerevisiae TaxID=39029 RepID=UPI0009CD68C9
SAVYFGTEPGKTPGYSVYANFILPTGTTVEGKTGLKMAAVSKSGFCAVDINYILLYIPKEN